MGCARWRPSVSDAVRQSGHGYAAGKVTVLAGQDSVPVGVLVLAPVKLQTLDAINWLAERSREHGLAARTLAVGRKRAVAGWGLRRR